MYRIFLPTFEGSSSGFRKAELEIEIEIEIERQFRKLQEFGGVGDSGNGRSQAVPWEVPSLLGASLQGPGIAVRCRFFLSFSRAVIGCCFVFLLWLHLIFDLLIPPCIWWKEMSSWTVAPLIRDGFSMVNSPTPILLIPRLVFVLNIWLKLINVLYVCIELRMKLLMYVVHMESQIGYLILLRPSCLICCYVMIRSVPLLVGLRVQFMDLTMVCLLIFTSSLNFRFIVDPILYNHIHLSLHFEYLILYASYSLGYVLQIVLCSFWSKLSWDKISWAINF